MKGKKLRKTDTAAGVYFFSIFEVRSTNTTPEESLINEKCEFTVLTFHCKDEASQNELYKNT